jgi:hypothetical protein
MHLNGLWLSGRGGEVIAFAGHDWSERRRISEGLGDIKEAELNSLSFWWLSGNATWLIFAGMCRRMVPTVHSRDRPFARPNAAPNRG